MRHRLLHVLMATLAACSPSPGVTPSPDAGPADTGTAADAEVFDLGVDLGHDAGRSPTRAYPSLEDLRDGVLSDDPVPTSNLVARDATGAVGAERSGAFVLSPARGRIRGIRDLYGILRAPEISTHPSVRIDWVTDGDAVVVASPGLHRTEHPDWDVLLGHGVRWTEPHDDGMERVLLPIHLVDRGENCTMQGVLTLLMGPSSVTHAYYQYGQETCPYFKADLWGVLDAALDDTDIDASRALEARASRASTALPLRPLEDLEAFGLDLAALRRGPDPDHVSAQGVVWEGVHYADAPRTRHGDHPLPDSLRLPSFSTAKSAFAALSAIALAAETPELLDRALGPVVGLAPDDSMGPVTLTHLLDMSTGHYDSAEFGVDEDGARMLSFFLSEGLLARTDAALGFPEVDPPGQRFVYHTSDTYLAARILDEHTRRVLGEDLYAWARRALWPRLGIWLDPETTLRDEPDGTPLAGYGLWWRPEELALLAHAFSGEAPEWASRTHWDRALRRDDSPAVEISPGFDYALGFWATTFGPAQGFPCEVRVPFMSGTGGITVAMLPNGAAYYYVSDADEFVWVDPVRELVRLTEGCP